MADPSAARLHAMISGTVQGVGFRYTTRDVARRLRLTGWVRNRMSGDVEVVAEGDREALEQLRAFLSRGPSGANVTRVNASWGAATGEFTSFTVTG